ncbi:GNAT family N-acetyltransferase [bacterium]|nr:GNAT family N-acetyltransferase [bacterium]
MKPADFKAHQDTHTCVSIESGTRDDILAHAAFLDWTPSWENSFEALQRIQDEVVYLKAVHDSTVGVLAYYPALNWIMTLAVDPSRRRARIATALLSKLVTGGFLQTESVNLLNVDSTDTAMKQFLLHAGFQHLISQYEMEKRIS